MPANVRSSNLVVRIQSPDHGTKRIEVHPSERISNFLNKIQCEFNLGDLGWSLYKNRDKTGQIRTSRAKTLMSYNVRHGDMLYIMKDLAKVLNENELPTDSATGSVQKANNNVILDEVDQILEKEDGKIHRRRNEQICRHGPQGKCLHCAPLEPYDEEFLKKCVPPVKFLSFHSYLRKLTGGVDKGKFAYLEDISCKIKSGCTEHPPWPGGICTKCQPNAVTLNRQKYRHVDNIMFENPVIADHFLNYWRSTGDQRLGVLYGRYEQHKELPLSIKATVAAIYEPPQISTKNKISLLPDEREELVNRIAGKLGLKPVGWIFTDLVADDLTKGTVKHFRGNTDSHFLSAEECIMAAEFQNKYPSSCRLSPDGKFGSKFVTVVVTGDSRNQIHFEGYQVSNQCMALVRDNCFVPTKDAPELGYVKESNSEQFVPDVFYKVKDEYGNEVTQLARPLPVEYLLVDIPCAFPVDPQFTFMASSNIQFFPKENRESISAVQDFNALMRYMEQFPPGRYLEAMSDFHLLIFLASNDMVPLKDKISMLLESVKNKDEGAAFTFKKTEEWLTIEQLIAAHVLSPSPAEMSSIDGTASALLTSAQSSWTCEHCTFMNESGKTVCDMCTLPR